VRALPFLSPDFIEASGCREGGGWKVLDGLFGAGGTCHVAVQSQIEAIGHVLAQQRPVSIAIQHVLTVTVAGLQKYR
jgi:hypothetical protein